MSNWNESLFSDPGMVFYRSYASAGTIFNKNADDNFNDNLFDTERWTDAHQPYTSISETGSKSQHTLTTGTTVQRASYLVNSVVLVGDFNYQVDFDCSAWANPSSGSINQNIAVTDSSGNYVVVLFGKSSSGAKTYQVHDTTGGPVGSIATSDNSGKLNIRRVGTNISGYYWNGSAWVLIATSSTARHHIGTNNCGIRIYAHTQSGTNIGTNKVSTFDNFQRNSGSYYLPNAYALSYDKDFGSGQLWGIGTVSGTGLSGSPSILIKALSGASAISNAAVTSEATSKTNITDWSGGSMPDGLQHARWGLFFYPDAGYLTAPTITEVDLAYMGMEAGPAVINDSLTLNDDVSVSFPDFASIGESLSPMEEVTATLTPPTTELGRKKYYLHKRSKFITFSGIDGEINHKVTFKGFELFMKPKRACKL